MPYCANCGTEVEYEARFCSECGKALDIRQTADRGPSPKKKKAKKRFKPVLIGLIVALMLVGGAFIYPTLFGDDDFVSNILIEVPDDPLLFHSLELKRGTVTDPNTGLAFVAGEVLVIPHEGVSYEEVVQAVETETDGQLVGGSVEMGLFQVEIPGDESALVLEAVAALEAVPQFKAVVPNFVVEFPTVTLPSVPQWTDSDEKKRWGQEYIELPKAWTKSTGEPELKVGIIEGGYDLRHADLKNRVTRLVLVDRKKWDEKDLRHGTIVSSIIGSDAFNRLGISGVLWESELHCYQVTTFYDVRTAIFLSVREGMDVVNLSASVAWAKAPGLEVDTWALEKIKELLEPAISYAYEEGVLIVVPAGNNPDVPAEKILPAGFARHYNNVIVVGAVDKEGKRADFSSWGEIVTVAAPGKDVWAAVPTKDKEYRYVSGTCIAAPFATGIAALIWSVNPDLSPAQVKEIIISTADPHDFDRPLGSGVVNAFRALEKATSKEYIKDPGQDLENEAGRLPEGVVNKYFMELQRNNIEGAFALYDPYILKELGLIGRMDDIIESFSIIIKEQPLIQYHIVDVTMLSDKLALVEVAGTVQYLGEDEQRITFVSVIKRDLIWYINPWEFTIQHSDVEESLYIVAVEEGSNLFIRRRPGSKNKPSDDIIDRVPRGQKLEVVNRHRNYVFVDNYTWWEVINTATGLKGWAVAEDLEKLNTIAADEKPTERESSISSHTIVGLFPLSSPLSTFGENSLEAARLAATDVNRWLEAESKNWRLRLEFDDTASDGQVGLSKMQSWHGEGVKFFAGPMTSGVALEMLSYANANQILFISPSSTHPDLAIEDDWLFRFCYDDTIDTIQPPVLGDQSYREHVRNHIISKFGREPDEEFAYNTYDIIWALALSIDRVGYNQQLVRTVLPDIVKEWSSKYGASGLIVLNKAGDRVSTY